DRMLACQPGCWSNRDKELRTVGIRAGVCHCQLALLVERMWRALRLILKFIAWPAESCSSRISALNHEVRNHPMEDRAVIQPVAAFLAANRMRPLPLALGKLNKIGDRLRGLFLEQTADNRPFARIKNRVSTSRTRHIFNSLNLSLMKPWVPILSCGEGWVDSDYCGVDV